VSVLALNKLELKDMINSEMVENPVLEELEDSIPLVDDVGRREEERERPVAAEENPVTAVEKKDPFEEIDFGSFFQEYLDPGYRSPGEMEEIERPSFENFLSKSTNLTDHLMWQLGSIPTRPDVREAAELIIGNLNEDGYLIATDEELLGVAPPAPPEIDSAKAEAVVAEAAALGLDAPGSEDPELSGDAESHGISSESTPTESGESEWVSQANSDSSVAPAADLAIATESPMLPEASKNGADPSTPQRVPIKSNFDLAALHEALELVRQLDPPGVACRDLRECLLYQLRFHERNLDQHRTGTHNGHTAEVITDALRIVDQHLRALQLKQHKEIAKALNRPIEAVQAALEFIRTLDPRPGLRSNKLQP